MYCNLLLYLFMLPRGLSAWPFQIAAESLLFAVVTQSPTEQFAALEPKIMSVKVSKLLKYNRLVDLDPLKIQRSGQGPLRVE